MEATGTGMKRRRVAQHVVVPDKPSKLVKPSREPSMRQLQISSLLKASKATTVGGKAKRIVSARKEEGELGALFSATLAESVPPRLALALEGECDMSSTGKGQKRDAVDCGIQESAEEEPITAPTALQPCQKRHKGQSNSVVPVRQPSQEDVNAVSLDAATADVHNGGAPELRETLKETSGAAEASHGPGDDFPAIVGGIDEAFARAFLPPCDASTKGAGIACPPSSSKRPASLLLREMRSKAAAERAGGMPVPPPAEKEKQKQRQPASALLREMREKKAEAEKEKAERDSAVGQTTEGAGAEAVYESVPSGESEGGGRRVIGGGWSKPWELVNSVAAPLRGFKSRGAMMVGLAKGRLPVPLVEEDRRMSPAKEVAGRLKETSGSGRSAQGPSLQKFAGSSLQRRLEEEQMAVKPPPRVLPERLNILEAQFVALETARSILKTRRQVCTWERVSPVVEGMTTRRFSQTQLAQLFHIMHDAMRLERMRMANPDDALNHSAATWDIEIDILDPPPPLSSQQTPPRGARSASGWRQILHTRLEKLAASLPEDAPLPQAELPRAPPPSAPPNPQPLPASPRSFCTPTRKRPTVPSSIGEIPLSSSSPPPRRRQVSPAPSLASPVSADLAGARRNLQSMLQSASKLSTRGGALSKGSDSGPSPLSSEQPTSGAPLAAERDGGGGPVDGRNRPTGEHVSVRFLESLDCGGDEILRVLQPDLLRSMQAKAQVQAKENSREAVSMRRRGQMVEQLPKMFDVLKSVFQRADRTVFPRQQLLTQLLAPHRGIVDRKEVEEQLELMLELAPEWFSSKKSISGETLYRIDKSVNTAIVRRRLVSA